MLLRKIKEVILKKVIITKESNGSRKEQYEEIKPYKVQIQELDDEISASIYGANIINMLKIKSPLSDIEDFLKTKLNNKTDNISKYYIFIGDNKYKIKSVNCKGIVIELV